MRTNLKDLRKAAGYKSAREFAEAVGINPSTYANYEHGSREPGLEQAASIARALGCSIDDIVGSEAGLDGDEEYVLFALRRVDADGRRLIREAAMLAERLHPASRGPEGL